MIAAFDRHLEAVRVHGADLTATLPAARPFVDSVRSFLEAIVESLTVLPEADRPPYTRKEAAEYLAISTSTLDSLRRNGSIVAVGENGLPSASGHRRQVRYAKAELDRVLGAK